MHQTSNSLITQIQSVSSIYDEEIQKLYQLKNEILQKMDQIDTLNIVFDEKNELSFLNTFRKFMSQLGDDLKFAVEAYQNIDHEIAQDPKCVLLSKQAQFYKHEAILMEDTYAEQMAKLNQMRNKNAQLKKKRNQLKRKSIVEQQRFSQYQYKNRSLSLRLNNSIDLDSSEKKKTESTKIHSSAAKTRVLGFDSQKKKMFSENLEVQSTKPNSKQFFRSKDKRQANIISQMYSSRHITSFAI